MPQAIKIRICFPFDKLLPVPSKNTHPYLLLKSNEYSHKPISYTFSKTAVSYP